MPDLSIIAVDSPVPKHLADFTVWAFLCGVGRVLRHLGLGGTILCVLEIKAVTYITEEAGFLLGLFFLVIAVLIVQVIPVPVQGCF